MEKLIAIVNMGYKITLERQGYNHILLEISKEKLNPKQVLKKAVAIPDHHLDKNYITEALEYLIEEIQK